MSDEKIELKATIASDTFDVLRDIAKEKNVSLGEAIRISILVEKYLLEARERGAKILIEEKGKPISQLIIG